MWLARPRPRRAAVFPADKPNSLLQGDGEGSFGWSNRIRSVAASLKWRDRNVGLRPVAAAAEKGDYFCIPCGVITYQTLPLPSPVVSPGW